MASYLRSVIEALPNPPPLYCLIGALALGAWGRVRSTQDIDLLVISQDSARTGLSESLASHGFHPDSVWLERNPMVKDRVLRLLHHDYPGLPLDLIFSADAHEESVLAHRKSMTVIGIPLWVCSAEDLLLLKLKASRPHDFEDALGIVKNPHLQLDRAYLWEWADQMGLQGELHYVFSAAAGPAS